MSCIGLAVLLFPSPFCAAGRSANFYRIHVATSPRGRGTCRLISSRDHAAQLGAGLLKYLLTPEVAVLLSYFDDLTRRMYFDTLWNTGARLNEALALRPRGFELEPSRKYPQPVVAIRTLKQHHIEASRKSGRTSTLTQLMHHLISATAPDQRRVF